jgi:hypothetical protein
MSVDWGGTNPHAVNWYQVLDYDVLTTPFDTKRDGEYIRLSEGTIVCFDEIYITNIGSDKLANLVKLKENLWKQKFSRFKVRARFADPQGKMARLDFKSKGLPTEWHTGRDKESQIQRIQDLFSDSQFVTDVRCEMFAAEIAVWQRDPKTEQEIEDFNHCMSNFRYAMANIGVIQRHDAKKNYVGTGKLTKIKSSPTKKAGHKKKGPVAIGAKARPDFPDNLGM